MLYSIGVCNFVSFFHTIRKFLLDKMLDALRAISVNENSGEK